MRIAVIGATGRLGGAVVAAAVDRGHDTTALGSADVDVTDAASVRRAVVGHDAVVVAVKGPDRLVPRAAAALLEAGVGRLVFIGGAGSLRTASGGRLVDGPDFPPQLRETALEQAEALETFRRAETGTQWSYLSPPPVRLVDGAATGRYRAEARETPMMDPTGDPFRTGDLASAVIDALEHGWFVGRRFTVGTVP